MTFDRAAFEEDLLRQEKSPLTIEKYLRDVAAFVAFAGERELDAGLTHAWKLSLIERHYTLRSVNSMLTGLNVWLRFLGREDCRVRNLKLQRELFAPEDRELTEEEYERLLDAALDADLRLYMLLQTFIGTGIRVSEHRFFTVESLEQGVVKVSCKNKNRVILIPDDLREGLRIYCQAMGITSGVIFRTGSGKPLDRSNIWKAMKRLCKKANVDEKKVFPHNLRKLFARCIYRLEKDLAKLADMLGHSSINTTRIYIMTSGAEHRKLLNRVGLVRKPVQFPELKLNRAQRRALKRQKAEDTT